MTTTLVGFAGQAARFPQNLRQAQERATGEACLVAKGAVIGAFRQGFPTGRLSHLGKRQGGAPFLAGYKVKKQAEGAVGIVTARGGAAYLADLGSYRHPSGYDNTKRGRGRNRKAQRGLVAANAFRAGFGLPAVAAPVGRHPAIGPIRGGGHFARGAAEATKVAPRIYASAVVSEMAKTFRRPASAPSSPSAGPTSSTSSAFPTAWTPSTTTSPGSRPPGRCG